MLPVTVACFCILSQWDTAFIALENWNVNLWNTRREKLDPPSVCSLYIALCKVLGRCDKHCFQNIFWKHSQSVSLLKKCWMKRREIYILSIFDVVFKAASILLGSFAQVLFWKNVTGKNFHADSLFVITPHVHVEACTYVSVLIFCCRAILESVWHILIFTLLLLLLFFCFFFTFLCRDFYKIIQIAGWWGLPMMKSFFFSLFEKVLLKLFNWYVPWLYIVQCSPVLIFCASARLSRIIVV